MRIKISTILLLCGSFLLLEACKKNPYKKTDGESIFLADIAVNIDHALDSKEIDLSYLKDNSYCKMNTDYDLISRNTNYVYYDGFNVNFLKNLDILPKGDFESNISPIVCDNILYKINNYGILYKYQIAPNNVISKSWSLDITSSLKEKKILKNSNMSLSYDKKKLFVTTSYGTMLAIDTDNGSILWKKQYQSGFYSSATIDENNAILYIATNSKMLYAIDAIDGKIIWEKNYYSSKHVGTSSAIIAPVLLYNNLAIFSIPSGHLICLDKATGNKYWDYKLTSNRISGNVIEISDISFSPVVIKDTLIAGGTESTILGVNMQNGQPIWNTNMNINSNIIHNDKDYAFFFDNKNNLIALNMITGKIKWINNEMQFIKTENVPSYTNNGKSTLIRRIYKYNLMFINSKIVVSDAIGNLYEINANNGTIDNVHQVTKMSNAIPFFVNNELYMIDDYNNLYSLK